MAEFSELPDYRVPSLDDSTNVQWWGTKRLIIKSKSFLLNSDLVSLYSTIFRTILWKKNQILCHHAEHRISSVSYFYTNWHPVRVRCLTECVPLPLHSCTSSYFEWHTLWRQVYHTVMHKMYFYKKKPAFFTHFPDNSAFFKLSHDFVYIRSS